MINSRFIVFLLLPFFVACSSKEQDPYCDNHGALHEEHRSSVVDLQIRYLPDGDIEADLRAPLSAFQTSQPSGDGAVLAQALADIESIFSVEAERPCVPGPMEVNSDGDLLSAHYQLSCGADNKLGEVKVHLFDKFPQLLELEARITTPAVKKYFVINRQCSRALFLVAPEQEN